MKKLFLSFFILFFFIACDDKENITPSGKVIKIGIVAPLSGKNKRLGNQSLLGLKAAKKMKQYLSNGDEIVFEIVDTKSDSREVSRGFFQLLASDVKVIIFFIGSNEMMKIKDYVHKMKTPTLVTLATEDSLVQEQGYIAQVCMDNHTQVLVASHYIKDEKFIENVGVIYNKRSGYSSSLANEFKKYYVTLGGKIKFFIDISKPIGLKKFKEYNKDSIKMLFNTTNSTHTTKVIQIINEQDSNLDILGTDGLYSGVLELKDDELELFNGVCVVEHYAHDNAKNKDRKRLETILREDYFKDSSFAFLAYDGYQLLVQSLENCPQYNSECINSILQNSDVVKGISGNFSMIDAKAQREVYIDKIEAKKLLKEVVIY